MKLQEKMKPEFLKMIVDGYYYAEAIKALNEKKYWIDITLSEFVAITSFTHPKRTPSITEFAEMFNN